MSKMFLKKTSLKKKMRKRHMAVSKAYLSCLDEEASQLFKKDIESANLTLTVAKKGLELFKKLTYDESEN
ncbi:hypothetical protein [Clostridium botulinum]